MSPGHGGPHRNIEVNIRRQAATANAARPESTAGGLCTFSDGAVTSQEGAAVGVPDDAHAEARASHCVQPRGYQDFFAALADRAVIGERDCVVHEAILVADMRRRLA